MGNCRAHWLLEELQFYKYNEIIVIDWPPYSPDLNPVENVCTFIKAKLGSKNFFNPINSKIIAIWKEISNNHIKKYWTSIYYRTGEWIK